MKRFFYLMINNEMSWDPKIFLFPFHSPIDILFSLSMDFYLRIIEPNYCSCVSPSIQVGYNIMFYMLNMESSNLCLNYKTSFCALNFCGPKFIYIKISPFFSLKLKTKVLYSKRVDSNNFISCSKFRRLVSWMRNHSIGRKETEKLTISENSFFSVKYNINGNFILKDPKNDNL